MDKDIKQMFELVLDKLGVIDKRMDTMETRQDEIYNIVKAIEHSNQVHKAEIDNINIRTAYVEGTINSVGDVIAQRRSVK